MQKYYETVPKKLCTSNEKILWNSANNNNHNNTVKVDFIPPIRDFELGLCVLWGGGGAVYTVSLNDL